MLKVVHDADASNENGTSGGSLLDEIVRDGARAMLAAALQAEVAAYIDTHLGEVDENGYRLVLRNGYRNGVQAHRVRTSPLARCQRTPSRRPGPRRSPVREGETRRTTRRIRR